MLEMNETALLPAISNWERSGEPFRDLAAKFPIDAKLMSGLVHPRLAADIANQLGVPLTDAGGYYHPNGEFSCRIQENVRHRDVIIVNPHSRGPSGRSPNDAIKEVRLMIDACARASARSIMLVTPYFGYQKQERKVAGRQPISARDTAEELIHPKVDAIVIVDLHAPAIQGFFPSWLPVDNLFALKEFERVIRQRGYVTEDLVIVSPDFGAMDRASRLAVLLGADLATIWKKRDPRTGKILEVKLLGNVRGKLALMVDDMVQSFGTMEKDADELVKFGAKRIVACATHADFTGDAIDKIARSPVEELIVTDTVPLALGPKVRRCKKITVISVAPLLAEAIWRHQWGVSISSMFESQQAA